MRARRLLSLAGALVLGAGGAVVGVGGSPAAYAADEIACRSIRTSDLGSSGSPPEATLPDPFAQLRIKAAQDALGKRTRPGRGVTVAVVDSGIQATGIAAQVVPADATGLPPATYYHGTTVAGLIAGKPADGSVGGIAPGARLLDLPVWVPQNSDTGKPGYVDPAAVTRALDFLLSGHGRLDHLIVNMSLDLRQDVPAIRDAVRHLTGRGAIVVAAGGNRENEDVTSSTSPSPYVGTEDHDQDVYPADYPGVVAVGASNTAGLAGAVGDPTEAVFANSAIDVAAPTAGARSWTLTGKPCVVDDIATSWSTAEVSGVLALLWSAYPKDTGAALVDRLKDTASGRADEPGLFTGAGVIQPYDAVTRPLGPPERTAPSAVPQARVAPPEEDVLKGTRHDAMWWGLLGGGALILALILRPLLSRRR